MALTAQHIDSGKAVTWDGKTFHGDVELATEALSAAVTGVSVPLPGIGDVTASATQPSGAWAALWWACRGRAWISPFPSEPEGSDGDLA